MKIFFLSLCSFFLSLPLFGQDSTWMREVTSQVGLSNATGFCINVCDVNNDDYPDLILVRSQNGYETNRDAVRLFINTSDSLGNRIFVERTKESGVNSNVSPTDTGRRTTLLALADINNDGFVDMVTGNWYHTKEKYTDNGDRCEVLLNDGQGHFSVVPNNGLHELGLIAPMGFSFLDYDNDGKIDLFIGSFFDDYTNDIFQPSHLMRGNGDGTFTDVSQQTEIGTNNYPLYGCNVADYNNDGLQDILTAPYCRSSGSLWENNGDGTFTDVGPDVGYNAWAMKGNMTSNGPRILCMWAAQPADFDNDGDVDLFFILVHGGNDAGEGRSTIVVNEKQGANYKFHWDLSRTTWNNPKPDEHGNYDASWFDLDNDGLVDLGMTEGGVYSPGKDRIYVFKQKPDHTFDDVTSKLNLLGKVPKAHAMEVLDYDLDGRDDLLSGESGSSKLHLFKNESVTPSGSRNNWVAVKLIAPPGVNRSCIGARITVYSGGIAQMKDIYSGQGNGCGQQPFIQNFGLGSNTVIDSITVRWPSLAYAVTTVKNPPNNQKITIDHADPVSITEKLQLSDEDFSLYPNPANDRVSFKLSPQLKRGKRTIEIMDALGRQMNIVSREVGSILTVDTHSFVSGWYVARLVTKDGQNVVRTFLKQ